MVQKDLFSRQSSVLGELPGPAEHAKRQLRARPIPPLQTNPNATVKFDAKLVQRLAAELDRRFAKLPKDKKGKPTSRTFGITMKTISIIHFTDD